MLEADIVDFFSPSIATFYVMCLLCIYTGHNTDFNIYGRNKTEFVQEAKKELRVEFFQKKSVVSRVLSQFDKYITSLFRSRLTSIY